MKLEEVENAYSKEELEMVSIPIINLDQPSLNKLLYYKFEDKLLFGLWEWPQRINLLSHVWREEREEISNTNIIPI